MAIGDTRALGQSTITEGNNSVTIDVSGILATDRVFLQVIDGYQQLNSWGNFLLYPEIDATEETLTVTTNFPDIPSDIEFNYHVIVGA